MRSLFLFAPVALVFCGAVAGTFVGGLVPRDLMALCDREMLRQPFVLSRSVEDPAIVREARWFYLPQIFGDFDLSMDIELGEDTDVDMLLRRVEPRYVDGVKREFAGRFSVLRLSTGHTDGGGERGWRTREQALFGPRGGGVGLAPGYGATVEVQARGRMLRATVAGKPQPWFEADDSYGSFTLIARGGTAVVHRLEIYPRSRTTWWWSRWTWPAWGALAGAIVLAFARALARRGHLLLAGLGMVLVAAVLAREVDAQLAFPDPAGLVALLAAATAAGIVLALDFGGLEALLGLLVTLWFGNVGLANLRSDDARVDAAFGPASGSQPAEALGQLVRGPAGLVDVDRDGPGAFLLGGQLVYDQTFSGGDPGDHLALQLELRLRGRFGRGAEVACLPTVDGFARQQWQLYERFYQGFQPEVIVLGIGPEEAAIDPSTGEPRSSAEQVREVALAARRHCEENGRGLVLYAECGVEPAMLQALRAAAEGGVVLVEVAAGMTPEDKAAALFRAIAAVMER
ncbi:MAG TPA: hypothetical protein ENI87_11735 [bacterium]|nr:hypothetical protein [bacterium]